MLFFERKGWSFYLKYTLIETDFQHGAVNRSKGNLLAIKGLLPFQRTTHALGILIQHISVGYGRVTQIKPKELRSRRSAYSSANQQMSAHANDKN